MKVGAEYLEPVLDGADIAQAVRDLLGELQAALPSAEAPQELVAPGKVQSLVSQIELELGGLS